MFNRKKVQQLQKKVEELTKDNQFKNQKICQHLATIEELKQKIYSLERKRDSKGRFVKK